MASCLSVWKGNAVRQPTACDESITTSDTQPYVVTVNNMAICIESLGLFYESPLS